MIPLKHLKALVLDLLHLQSPLRRFHSMFSYIYIPILSDFITIFPYLEPSVLMVVVSPLLSNLRIFTITSFSSSQLETTDHYFPYDLQSHQHHSHRTVQAFLTNLSLSSDSDAANLEFSLKATPSVNVDWLSF